VADLSRYNASDFRELLLTNLPAGEFLSVFEKSRVTASYKMFWLLAIIDFCLRNERHIAFHDLFIRMLAEARQTRLLYRLNFGHNEIIAKTLDRLEETRSLPAPQASHQMVEEALRACYQKRFEPVYTILHQAFQTLKRYVPYAFLSPWCKADKPANVVAFAEANFQNHKCLVLYKFAGDSIILQPRWLGYIRENARIVRDYALWHLGIYLQERNPMVPNIIGKMQQITDRSGSNLAALRPVWKEHIHATNLRCLYTGQVLTNNYAVDHFLPWTYVLHDQVWNTIPVEPRVNIQKTNKLPPGKYLNDFAEIQFRFFGWLRQMRDHKAHRLSEQYIDFFQTDPSDLPKSEFVRRMVNQIAPHLERARFMGFEDWSA
jgi:hypothetical protein